MLDKLARLQKNLGYQFKQVDLLTSALSHRSCGSNNNERLEYLGDALLGFVIADSLYQKFPKAAEGELSRLRARLVKGVSLSQIARQLDLGEYIKLGPGEKKSGGHRRDSILADAVEAILGAIYLDGGHEPAQLAISNWFKQLLDNLSVSDAKKDPKTKLQELLQSRKFSLPLYQVVSTEGAVHDQVFEVLCTVEYKNQETLTVQNKAKSRRIAEQKTAEEMLQMLAQRGLK